MPRMRKTKSTIFKSFVIAVILGTLFSFALNILSATYIEKVVIPPSQGILYGIDAVKASIKEFGVMSLVRMLIAYFAIFFLAVLTGCLWFNKWQSK